MSKCEHAGCGVAEQCRQEPLTPGRAQAGMGEAHTGLAQPSTIKPQKFKQQAQSIKMSGLLKQNKKISWVISDF